MRNRPVYLLALGGLAVTLIFAAQQGPAQQTVALVETAQPAAKEAAPAVKINPNKVTAVTVYANSALVTREVDAAGPAGRVELVVSPLPSTTVISSLYAEGTEGIRVLTTRHRTRPIVEDTRADVKKLQEEVKTLQLAREKIEGDLSALQENGKMLTKMESFLTVTTVQATEKGGLNADQAIALAKHIRDARIESAKENVNLKQQIQANQEKANAAQARLSQLTAGVSRYENDAVIVIDKANAGAGTIRLNYLVENASWHPQYKLRADKNNKELVTLEYLAGVVQNTGEDWSNVKLVLSTAQPMLNATPPDLQTLHVAATPKGTAAPSVTQLEAQIKSLRSQAQKEFNEKKVMSGAGLVNYAAAREQSFELYNPEAAVLRGCMLSYREGPTVTYRIATPLTVPSRSDEQVLEVARTDLKAEFYFKAVPILSPHAYRMAEMMNKSENVILPGDATMYSGTDFVGQMTLPLVTTGETFTVGFGVDPQLQVSRAMIDKLRTTSGGNQQLRYDYRIMVSNFKGEKVKLQVWDRLPFAENDSIGVQLLKTTPELSKDSLYLREQRNGNLLRWDITADANSHGEKATPINFEFKLELDRNMTIGGFQTAVNTAPAQQNPLPAISAADQVKIRAAMEKLSPEDRRVAESQVYCAVDHETPLGATGPILKVMANGKPVLVCCKGCESEVKKNPDDALLQLQKLMGRMNAARR